MNNFILYVKESYNELINKVSWPSYPALIRNTILVSVASIILALIIFLMDTVFQAILEQIYKINL